MISTEEARAQGRKAAEKACDENRAGGDVWRKMKNLFKWSTTSYPALAGLDLKKMMLEFSEERMNDDLDLARYPECRGLREAVEAQRRGFAEIIDEPIAAAIEFDWNWFCSRRLSTRFVSVLPPESKCTSFWFSDSKEGGAIQGDNGDDVIFFYEDGFAPPPETGPSETRFTKVTQIGCVSSAVLCDEEPENLFPVDLDWVRPDFTDLTEFIAFMERYREFWGPGNYLFIDPDMNLAAVEKANIRMGVRYSRGWAAITACAYLIPEMNDFHHERARRSFEARGWGEDNPDAAFWAGAEKRYHRLLELVEKEYERGATVLGAAQIALDHAVPFPDRICLEGQKGHPDLLYANWTIVSSAACVAGPNRRELYWVIDPTNPQPIYTTPCHVIPGEGLEARRAEWEQEVAQAGEIGLSGRKNADVNPGQR